MQKYLDILKNSALFFGIDTKDLINMFKCLLMNIKTYEKNSYILKASEPLVEVGIILKGRVNIIKEDYWGNRTILTTLSTGDLFGESFVCTNINNNCFSIVTAEKAEIMFLNYQKITSPCQFACNFHSKIIQNMLLLIAKKNIQLTTKIDHLSKKTTREKILSYLSSEALKNNSNSFTIPFNRQELADFLSVERSAMSAELSRMQKDKLITYHKNNFTLL